MRVSVIGTGYVGLVVAAALADHGNDVVCADVDQARIAGLERGEIPIFEPGLDDMVAHNVGAGRLRFTTDNSLAARHAEILFFAVGTPMGAGDGAPDLRALTLAVESCAQHLDGYTVIVNKSTVPVGTAQRVRQWLEDAGASDFSVVSNPEFLKEGAALRDFMHPDRVVIGTSDARAQRVMRRLYQPMMRSRERLIVMDEKSAELTKYTANAYLAMRVSFINDIANLCESTGANVAQVRRGIGSDTRIGHDFLYPGIGYGGSCFPKDTRALLRLGREHGLALPLIEAADRINEIQKLVLLRKIRAHVPAGDSTRKVVALWGLAFKPNTDDVREAPALSIARGLLNEGARLRISDPAAAENFCHTLGVPLVYGDDSVEVGTHEDPYEAARGADALVLATEWRQYRSPDFERLHRLMRQHYIFDGRNQWDRSQVEALGFEYHAIGC